jgi:NAD(P)-dependent dehydrogenase (short-subunit alcohol dehydrogenase family)
VLAVNLTRIFNVAQQAAKRMAKAGVIALTKSMALELAQRYG